METKSIMIERLKAYRLAVIETNNDAFITTDYPVVFYTPNIEHGTYKAEQLKFQVFFRTQYTIFMETATDRFM